MPTEFELSIVDHAVASGRDANCFFQSFFHTLTSLPQHILEQVQRGHPNSIQAFVDTFNNLLSLEPHVSFHKIIEMSQSMHPLERECVLGPILRQTYNTMVDRGLLAGNKLQIHPDAIVLQPQIVGFANAFGAEISAYMSQEQLELSIEDGMPSDVAERIRETRFEIEDRVFYRDCSPDQRINHKCFAVNLVYADNHLNYTLGTRALNKEHRDQVVTQRTGTRDGIFAIEAVSRADAPMAEKTLSFDNIATMLRKRFSLTTSAAVNSELTPEALLAARELCGKFREGIPRESSLTGKIILLCGTSTAGKTSICTALQTEARKTGQDWIVDGGDIAADKAWTEPCEIAGSKYPSAKEHLVTVLKKYAASSVVDAAVEIFGVRTLATAVFSREKLGHPKIDIVDLTPEPDIKSQSLKIYETLSSENKAQYKPVDIENLLIIIRDCPKADAFLSQHPYPPLADLNKLMLERAITSAKRGESTIFDIIGNEVIDEQRIVDQFHDRLKTAGLPPETGTVVMIHCPVATLINRMDDRNRKAIAEDRKDDVRNAFFPFGQYGELYEKAPAVPDFTRPIVGVVTRHDITNAARKFGREVDATSLLEKLGFTDGDESISVVSRLQSDVMFQTGTQSPQQIAVCLCERSFTNTPAPNDTEMKFG